MGVVRDAMLDGKIDSGTALSDVLTVIAETLGISVTQKYLENILNSPVYWSGIEEKIHRPFGRKEQTNEH